MKIRALGREGREIPGQVDQGPLSIECPTCREPPGRPCVTERGRLAQKIHVWRRRVAIVGTIRADGPVPGAQRGPESATWTEYLVLECSCGSVLKFLKDRTTGTWEAVSFLCGVDGLAAWVADHKDCARPPEWRFPFRLAGDEVWL